MSQIDTSNENQTRFCLMLSFAKPGKISLILEAGAFDLMPRELKCVREA
jgi:hypothetical protein